MMKYFFLIVLNLLLLSILSILSTNALANVPLNNTNNNTSIAPMLKNVLPAVVNIKAQIKITDLNILQNVLRKRRNQNNNNTEEGETSLPSTYLSVGSGVIIDSKNGFILTNAHVIADAQMITVTLGDGRHFTAKIIGMDKPSDVGLLQIKAKNLTAAVIDNSNKIEVGDFVAAVGNPFGLGQTVTSGIVSATGRTTLGIETYENFIQTDAPINPGNSGGALINMQGKLIGINTAILAPNQGSIGIGFAIPTNMAISVMQQLLQYGNVKRGVLGIGAQDITPELANAFNIADKKGAAVTMVQPQSPAYQAGIQAGDIITAINGIPIKSASDVVNTVGFLRVDTTVNINLLRQTKPLTIHVPLSDPKKREHTVQQLNPFLYGVTMKNFAILTPIHGTVQGVLIVSVEEESLAWQSDLRPGDIITSVNQQKIKNIEELKTITAKANQTLLLNILRGPGALFLVMNNEKI
jgi:serine protease Do